METLDFGLATLDEQLWQVMFLSIRCGAAFLAAPMIGGMAIPPTLRVLLALAFGLFIANWMPIPDLPEMLSFAAVLAIVQEALLGAALGILLQIAFAIPLVAAEQIAGTMGLAIATSIDPNSGAQSGALGTYFGLILTLLFYAIGAHLLWFELLLASYQLLPAGSFVFDAASGRDIALFMGYGFATAALIAFPVVLILLLVQIVTGVISRSAPALNLFALGLPAGVLAGIAALIVVMPVIVDQFTGLIEVTLDRSALLIEQAGVTP